MKMLTVLGSTGSIGCSTLDVVARHPDQFSVLALTANTDVEGLLKQIRQFKPQYAVMVDEDSANRLFSRVKEEAISVEILSGKQGLVTVATLADMDYLMAAIVGAAGLEPTIAAAKLGKRILLANKETLVVSGHLFMDAIASSAAELLPIDSEHNAIFQCLPQNGGKEGVERILLTASGGPFRKHSMSDMLAVTPAQACAHPNWDMGRKISVDSATMMNKGLEIIEACWLFSLSVDDVEVVVHPQSIIHSMVSYNDGSVIAQLGNPDMRTPIAYAMAWPDRMVSGVAQLDIFDIARLDFEAPDMTRFPCLKLASDAIKEGGTMPAVLNAANEIAVQAFLDERIGFMDIPVYIEDAMGHFGSDDVTSLEQLLGLDNSVRRWVAEQI